MTTSPTLTLDSAIAELSILRKDRARIDDRIADILKQFPEGADLRPRWHCERCAHDWFGQDPLRPPRGCPNCGSTGWRFPSTRANARRPDDPPNPKWRKNRRTGLPRVPLAEKSFAEHARDARSRVRHKRNGEPLRSLTPPPRMVTIAPPPRMAEVAPSLVARPEVRFADPVLDVTEILNAPDDGVPVRIEEDGSITVLEPGIHDLPEAIDTDGSILEEDDGNLTD